MFGIPLEDVDKEQRRRGKIAELALGYQGGLGAMTAMGGEQMGLTENEMTKIVKSWRRHNPKIVKLWQLINDYSVRTVRTGVKTKTGVINLRMDGDTFVIDLPSGKSLYYPEVKVEYNNYGNTTLSFMGVSGYTHKWERIPTYGGKLVENIVQAISRDLLADAMLRVDKKGYDIIMHVHDEIVVNAPDNGEDHLTILNNILGINPPWAKGLPLTADGFTAKFYQK